jgi:hypothetical protein
VHAASGAPPVTAAAWLLLAVIPPHIGPPIWVELLIEEDAVTLTLSGEPDALETCLGAELDLVAPVSEAARVAAEEGFGVLLSERAVLSIDGRPVPMELSELELPVDDPDGDGWLIVSARCRVPLASPPRNVGVVWQAYDGAEFMDEVFVPLTILWGRKVQGLFVLEPAEPEYVWHRPEDGVGRARALEPAIIEVAPTSRRVPLLSIAVALTSVGVWVVMRRRPSPTPVRIALVCGGLVGAGLLRDVGTIEVGSARREVVALPARDQAFEIFETLHRNVYDAFAARTEDEIYDLLAVSVDLAILDEIYADVYDGLILREEGGAISEVESLDVLDRDVVLADFGAPEFDVTWHWRVNGLVSHWGHLHRRTNEYRAKYRVHHDGRAWKIADATVLEQRRVESGE